MTAPTRSGPGRRATAAGSRVFHYFLSLPSPAPQVLVILLIVLVVWAIPASFLSVGGISHIDEFFTLDRTTSFARHDDWLNVYSENEVTFRKPPLQYWIGALLLENGVDLTAAVRLPSVVFALGGLLATGLLAHAIAPGNPWVMPASVLLVASSDSYWESAVSAMLESGAVFLLTLCIAGTIMALRRPAWWYFVAVAVGLSALQKAPIGLLCVALYCLFLGLTSRWHPYGFRRLLEVRAFRRSAILAVVLAFSWHMFQVAQHGWIAISASFGEQMIGRFAPSFDGTPGNSPGEVANLVFDHEYALRGLGLVALGFLPFRLRRPELAPLPLILLCFVAAVILASGFISHRYSQLFLPWFAVALAATILTLPLSARWLAAIIVAISILSHGPIKLRNSLNIGQDQLGRDQIAILERFARNNVGAGRLVFCHWDRPTRIPPGMIAYYGSNGRPFTLIHTLDGRSLSILANGTEETLAGVCTAEQIDILAEHVVDLRILDREGIYRHWSAAGAR